MANLFDIDVAGSFKTLEEGTYDGVVHAIIGLGRHTSTYEGKTRTTNRLKLLFEVPHADSESDVLSYKTLTLTTSEKGGLFLALRALGLVKTVLDIQPIFKDTDTVKQLIGRACSIKVVHVPAKTGDRVYANIESISLLDPRLPQPVAKLDPFIFTFSAPDIAIFKDKLSPWNRKDIMSADNANELPAEFHEAYITEQAAQKAKDAASTSTGSGVI